MDKTIPMLLKLLSENLDGTGKNERLFLHLYGLGDRFVGQNSVLIILL